MFLKPLSLAATLVVLAGVAAAQTTHTVEMLNRGEAGPMVFEPAFLHVPNRTPGRPRS